MNVVPGAEKGNHWNEHGISPIGNCQVTTCYNTPCPRHLHIAISIWTQNSTVNGRKAPGKGVETKGLLPVLIAFILQFPAYGVLTAGGRWNPTQSDERENWKCKSRGKQPKFLGWDKGRLIHYGGKKVNPDKPPQTSKQKETLKSKWCKSNYCHLQNNGQPVLGQWLICKYCRPTFFPYHVITEYEMSLWPAGLRCSGYISL